MPYQVQYWLCSGESSKVNLCPAVMRKVAIFYSTLKEGAPLPHADLTPFVLFHTMP